jgi:hypothetical protein
MPQTTVLLDRPKYTSASPSFPRLRYITHPYASGTVTVRYIVEARLLDDRGFATDTLRQFDVVMPYYLTTDSAIERLLKSVTADRYQVRSKVEQAAKF